MRTCPNCGKPCTEEAAYYCSNCAALLPPPAMGQSAVPPQQEPSYGQQQYYYQPPPNTARPTQPFVNNPELKEKLPLFAAIGFFGWAVIFGLPKLGKFFELLGSFNVLNGRFFFSLTFSFIWAGIMVGLHLIVPVIAGMVLLGKWRKKRDGTGEE